MELVGIRLGRDKRSVLGGWEGRYFLEEIWLSPDGERICTMQRIELHMHGYRELGFSDICSAIGDAVVRKA